MAKKLLDIAMEGNMTRSLLTKFKHVQNPTPKAVKAAEALRKAADAATETLEVKREALLKALE